VPSQETLLTVILVAISLNLLLAIGILLAARRSGRARAEAAGRGRFGRTGAPLPSAARPLAPVFGAPPHGQHVTDPQTGLEVGATWERWLVEEEARTKRYRRPATVVLVELDGLDRLVERLGPAAADRLIPPVAATLRRHARAADRIARLGKGRFGVVLVETDEVAAINYIERVRAAADMWLEAGAVATRLSIGWAEANAGRTLEDAAAAAEDRLNGERRRHASANPGGSLGDGPLAEPALG
jgi:diguanylate cyclase (GGDEF)-like protein